MKYLPQYKTDTRSSTYRGEAIWVALGIGGSVLATIVGVRLLTTVMTPEEYGRLALAVSVGMAIMHSFGFGIGTTMSRFYAVSESNQSFKWYWDCLQSMSSWFFFLVVLGVLFFCLLGAVYQSLAIIYWGLALVWGGLVAFNMSLDSVQNAARQRKIFCWHRNLFGWLRFLLAFLMVYYLEPTALGALLGFVAATLLTMLSEIYFVLRLRRRTTSSPFLSTGRKEEHNELKQFYSYLWPMILIGFFSWAQLFADRWAINFFADTSEVGIYFALYQLSFSLAIQATDFLMNFIGPVLFKASGNLSDGKEHVKAIKVNQIVVGFMIVGLFVVFWVVRNYLTQIGNIFLGQSFRTHLELLPWMLLAGGFYAIGQQLLMSVYMGLNTRKILCFRGAIALLACLSVIFGGAYAGIEGVTFGLLFFSTVFFLGAAMYHWGERSQVLDCAAVFEKKPIERKGGD